MERLEGIAKTRNAGMGRYLPEKKVSMSQMNIAALDKIVVQEFSAKFLNENYCREWTLRKLHKEARCPRCLATLTAKQEQSFWQMERVKCSVCELFFTALTGTMFSGTRMSFARLVYLLFLIGTGWNALYVASCVGLTESAVRFWQKKLHSDLTVEHSA